MIYDASGMKCQSKTKMMQLYETDENTPGVIIQFWSTYLRSGELVALLEIVSTM